MKRTALEFMVIKGVVDYYCISRVQPAAVQEIIIIIIIIPYGSSLSFKISCAVLMFPI